MRVFEYQLKAEPPSYNFKRMFDTFIKGKTLVRKNKPFKISDYDSVISQIERIKEDQDEKKDVARIMISQIEDQIPPNNEGSVLIQSRKIEPSDFEKAKFIRLINILSDPLIIFDLAAKSQLGFMEMEALQNYMPELFAQINEASIESVTEFLAKNPLIEIPEKVRSQLSRFLGIPELSPETMQIIQQNYEGGQDEEQAAAPKGKPAMGRFKPEPSKIATGPTKIAFGLNE